MKTQYYPIQRDDDYLFKFITEILDFLEGPKPNFDEKCGLCNLKKITSVLEGLKSLNYTIIWI